MRRCAVALLGACAIGVALAAGGEPADVASSFYGMRLRNLPSGAPREKDMPAVARFMSPELVCLLRAARRYSDRFAKAFPNEKPPFVDGDLYSSVYEGPTRFEAEDAAVEGDTARVRMHMYYDEKTRRDADGWTDLVRLRRLRGHWLIDDIEYRGSFDFGNQGSLAQQLREQLGQPDTALKWGASELRGCTAAAAH